MQDTRGADFCLVRPSGATRLLAEPGVHLAADALDVLLELVLEAEAALELQLRVRGGKREADRGAPAVPACQHRKQHPQRASGDRAQRTRREAEPAPG